MKEINKPIHKGDKKSENKLIDFSSMDVGKLGLGLVGLGTCAQYLYPSLFSLGKIAVVSSSLVTGGIALAGGITGALIISVGMKEFSKRLDSNPENSKVINSTSEDMEKIFDCDCREEV